MKMMMIVNSSNENICDYYPSDSPQKLVNELHDVTNGFKNILSKGNIETATNKFNFMQYIPLSNNKNTDEDKLVIFICSEKNFKDTTIDTFFNKSIEILEKSNYDHYKINEDTKINLAKLFLMYQDCNDVKSQNTNWDTYSFDYGSINEFTSLGLNPKHKESLIYGLSETIDEKELKKINRSLMSERSNPVEMEKIKQWKKLKCVYLAIDILLLVAAVISLSIIINKYKEDNK